jgi:hypothetical protein
VRGSAECFLRQEDYGISQIKTLNREQKATRHQITGPAVEEHSRKNAFAQVQRPWGRTVWGGGGGTRRLRSLKWIWFRAGGGDDLGSSRSPFSPKGGEEEVGLLLPHRDFLRDMVPFALRSSDCECGGCILGWEEEWGGRPTMGCCSDPSKMEVQTWGAWERHGEEVTD